MSICSSAHMVSIGFQNHVSHVAYCLVTELKPRLSCSEKDKCEGVVFVKFPVPRTVPRCEVRTGKRSGIDVAKLDYYS